MSKIPGNLQAIMQQAKQMQAKLKQAQEDAKGIEVESSSGGGMVKVKVNGENQIISLEIKPEAVIPDDVEMLQDMIIAACNEALTNVQNEIKEGIAKVTGGVDIPGLF